MDLKSNYKTILAEIEKENAKIDEEIKKLTTKLKDQKNINNSHAKKLTNMIAEIEGTAIPKKRGKKVV